MSLSTVKNYKVLFNDQLVYEGSSEQVGKKFHVSKDTVVEYANKGKKLGGLFDVVGVEIEDKYKKSERESINFQVIQLTRYKNTVAMKNLERNISLLAEVGLIVKPRKVKGEKCKGMKRADSDYYILELVEGG